MKINTTLAGIFCLTIIITLTLLLVLSWPFAVLWSLNALFGTSISYTFLNWLAVNVLLFTLLLVNITKK